MSAPLSRPAGRLTRLEQFGLWALVFLFVGWGVVVEIRGALLQKRWTDFAVFARAAWAVRSGNDLYRVTDDKGLHYHYPPFLAVLLMPFADAPPGVDRAGLVPFPLAVGIWYVVSLACVGLAIHWLASALEWVNSSGSRGGEVPERWGRAWWALRVVPLAACLPAIGFGLSLGQVTALLLLLLAGAIAAVLRGHRFRAGLWLAGAVCLKLIPILLVLYPLWRRDRRGLAGLAVGLAVGLVVLPVGALGPVKTAAYYREWFEVLILPGLGMADNGDRAEELLDVTATQSQSPLSVIHHTLNWHRAEIPPTPSPLVRLSHWAIGGLMTLATLRAAGNGRRGDAGGEDRHAEAIILALLIVNMLVLSPVCHQHYLTLLVPLCLGLMSAARSSRDAPGPVVTLWLLRANLIVSLMPFIPGCKPLHHLGAAMYMEMILWGVGLHVLSVRRRAGSTDRSPAHYPVPVRLGGELERKAS